MSPEVLAVMMPYLTYEYGNPGSLHCYGRSAKEAVDRARKQTAAFLGCEPEQVVFTSGGSEGNNFVIQQARRGHHVLVSAIEHDSILRPAFGLHSWGYIPKLSLLMPDKNGRITQPELERMFDDEVTFVSVMESNNETGATNDVPKIAAFCHANGALFHTDAVQSAGFYDLKAEERGFDFLTVSSHKIGGPKGVGALYIRDPSSVYPLIAGGAEQEFGLRGGTENVAGIVGFGKACEIAVRDREKNGRKLLRLEKLLLETLRESASVLEVSYILNTDPDRAPKTPKTTSIRFPGIDAQSMILMLDSLGVYVSAGSACTSHESTPSHVLKAMGLSDEDAHSSIRVSFSPYNTEEEVADAAKIIVNCAHTMRRISDV